MSSTDKHFFLITGPPAVGKMTVAQALCKKTGFKMMHNHQSIELALTMFGYGNPGFKKINEGIRQLVFRTTSESKNLNGFIFTLVLAFELQEDWDYLNEIRQRYESNGWQFHIVELESQQTTRLSRNNTPNRLQQKPSKQDLEMSSSNIVKMDKKHRMNSNPEEMKAYSYLRINNNSLSPDETADAIIAHFNLDTHE